MKGCHHSAAQTVLRFTVQTLNFCFLPSTYLQEQWKNKQFMSSMEAHAHTPKSWLLQNSVHTTQLSSHCRRAFQPSLSLFGFKALCLQSLNGYQIMTSVFLLRSVTWVGSGSTQGCFSFCEERVDSGGNLRSGFPCGRGASWAAENLHILFLSV